MRFVLPLILAGLLFQSCVEPFEPDIEGFDEILVVDGLISDEDQKVRVILSRSFAYDQNRTNPESDALVFVEDEAGNLFYLEELKDGEYVYAEDDFQPRTGDFYRLNIVTDNGNSYRSEFVEMLTVPTIDSINFIDRRGEGDESVLGREGVEIFLNSTGSEGDTRYYRWAWEESWEIMSPLNYPEVKTCWQFSNSKGISISTTENLIDNNLDQQYLYVIPFTNNKLAIRYSALIKQYSSTRDNYIYLTKIQKINEGSGGFFDPIPAGLTSNIQNVEDPDEPVLGLFEASEVQTKRIFIDRTDLRFGYVATGFEDCEIRNVLKSDWESGSIRNFFYVYEYFDSSINDTIVVISNLRKCYDCSYVGETSKPGYWIDE